MADSPSLNPHPREFEQFLYASVGEDRNGFSVTVLSTLARLDLDPWTETANLVSLGREGARVRLGALLARFLDVPALASDHGRVARDLSQLLPDAQASRALKQAAASLTDSRTGANGAIWVGLAVVLVFLQVVVTASMGSGE